MFYVGGCPELGSKLTGAEQKHNKPFEMDTKIEERTCYPFGSGTPKEGRTEGRKEIKTQ